MNADNPSIDSMTSGDFRASDEPLSAESSFSPRRQPLYFPSGSRSIFGWYHGPAADRARDCAIVICNPLGYEYAHSYRSLRHLAEQLAEHGFATIRFDYDGTGDSPGSDLDSNRVHCWQEDIRGAIRTVRELSGCERVGLIGLRMGAALAASVASTDGIPLLILWAPCSSKQYVREMKAIARSTSNTDQELGFESGGFTLLHETATQLSAIDFKTLHFQTPASALLLQRDDLEIDSSLQQHLRDCGIDATQITAQGYAAMMAEPQFTEVPFTAIEHIISWLEDHSVLSPHAKTGNHISADCETTLAEDNVELSEHCYEFGQQRHLFGIMTEPKNQSPHSRDLAVVMLNSGSVHHVGPNRLYVGLTRKLAARGYPCLRFDLQGLGDSTLIHSGVENHSYPKSALNDTADALRFLKTELGYKHFILAGLCSGAHAAFHAAVGLPEFDISSAMLINPLTFRYVDGMSLSTSHFQDVEYYKKSARSLKSWMKLLRGQVDLKHLAGLGIAQITMKLASLQQAFNERFAVRKAPELAQELLQLNAQQRSMSLIVAEGDPGYNLLKSGARYTSTRLIKQGRIHLHFIAKANHTFSSRKPREELIEVICDEVSARAKNQP
ncbi:MAG: alpha/beta fold hydrolase [Spongiibacteraceae bacterium]